MWRAYAGKWSALPGEIWIVVHKRLLVSRGIEKVIQKSAEVIVAGNHPRRTERSRNGEGRSLEDEGDAAQYG
jgi:hypothetical protein